MTDIYGYSTDSSFPNGINTNIVSSLDATANITLGSNDINLSADNVLINGEPIPSLSGFVTNPMSAVLNANDFNISNAGDILATAFIKNGGTSQQYLMGDGSSLQYSANSGNSNFYLYNNGTDEDPTPLNGYLTYNAPIQDDATFIYISHRTRDNIDIEVFFKNLSSLNEVYIQDQENSANSITYNITGTPVIVEQAQITIPVTRASSFGTGITSFGNAHNILLSFFTNSIETDGRITTLETKTQLITANFQKTILSGGSQMKLNTLDSFVVSLDVGLNTFTKFTISGTQVSSLIPMNMSFQKLRGIPTPVDNDGAANKEYIDTAYITLDGRTTALEGKTQNMSATVSGSQFDKNSSFVLRVADADFFIVRNDLGVSKLAVSNTSVQINSVPLFMQGQRIQLVGTPVDVADATNRQYVDSANALKLDKVPTLIQQGGLKWAKVNGAVTQGSAVGVFDLIGTPLSTAVIGSTTFSPNEITPFSTYIITVGGRITLPSNSGCTLSVTMNGVVVDPVSFGNNPNITGGGFESKFTWTFRAGGVLSQSIIHNIGGGSQNTTGTQGGGGSATINTAIQQVMGVQFASPTFTTPNITTYTITCVKL